MGAKQGGGNAGGGGPLGGLFQMADRLDPLHLGQLLGFVPKASAASGQEHMSAESPWTPFAQDDSAQTRVAFLKAFGVHDDGDSSDSSW
jgi:hypothetical protein